MLINCPRCGFQQPDDEYCASCGVNMSRFKPKEIGFFQKLLKNPLFSLGAVLILGTGTYFYLSSKRVSTSATIIAASSNLPQNSQKATQASLLPPPPPSSDQINELSVQAETAALEMEEKNLPPQVRQTASAAVGAEGNELNDVLPPPAPPVENTGGTAAPNTNSANSRKVEVIYAEIPSRTLASLTSAAQSSGEYQFFGEYSAGEIGSEIANILSQTGVKILKRELFQISSSGITEINHRAPAGDTSGTFKGVRTFMQLDELQPGSETPPTGQLEIQVTLRLATEAPGVPPTTRTFPGNFSLNSEKVFLLAGFMPHQIDLATLPRETIEQDIFQVYKSRDFTSGQSELVIILSPKN